MTTGLWIAIAAVVVIPLIRAEVRRYRRHVRQRR